VPTEILSSVQNYEFHKRTEKGTDTASSNTKSENQATTSYLIWN